MPDWDEDEELFGDEEETDLGDEKSIKVPVVEHRSSSPKLMGVRSVNPNPQPNLKPNNNGRRVKVKPMPSSIANKWPDVVSMFLTTREGKQVLFVRG